MRNIGVLGLSNCACGATFFTTPQKTVFIKGMAVLVAGAVQTHGGVVAPLPGRVFAQGLPVARIGDVTPYCPWVKPPHAIQPIISGAPTEYTL